MPFFVPIIFAAAAGTTYLMEKLLEIGEKRRLFETNYFEPRILGPSVSNKATSYGSTSYGSTSYGSTSYGPTSYVPTPYAKRIKLERNEEVETGLISFEWRRKLPYLGNDKLIWRDIHLKEKIFPPEIKNLEPIGDTAQVGKPDDEAKEWVLSEYEEKTTPSFRGVKNSPILTALSAPNTPSSVASSP